MEKFKLTLDQLNIIGMPPISTSAVIYIIPQQCDNALEDYLQTVTNLDTLTFRRNHYKVLTAMLLGHSTSSVCSDYRKHINIQNNKCFITNNMYWNMVAKRNKDGKMIYKYEYYSKRYHLKDKPSSHYLIVDYPENIDNDDDVEIMDTSALRHNHWFSQTLKKIKLNVPEAILKSIIYYTNKHIDNYETAEFKITRAINKISKFNESIRNARSGTNVDRIYTTINGLPKIVRTCLHINGKKFVEFDMSAAQPTLLLLLFKKYNLTSDALYIKNVSAIYKSIMDFASELNFTEEKIYNTKTGQYEYFSFLDKTHVKILLLRNVYASTKTEKQSLTSFIFKELYPKTYASLIILSEITEVSPANSLQNEEAHVMFVELPDCYFYSVHDAMGVIDIDEGEKYCSNIKYKCKDVVDVDFKIDNIDLNIDFNITDDDKIKIICPNRKPNNPTKHKKHNASSISKERYCRFKALYDANPDKDLIMEKVPLKSKNFDKLRTRYNNEKKKTELM